MRRTPILIAGGGPAGSAAAITLARGGATPLVLDRATGPRDVVCGGFLGWDSLRLLNDLGINPSALGARPIERLRLVTARRTVEVALPHAAAGLSRRTLDAALLDAAQAAGAEVRRGVVIRETVGRRLRLDGDEEIGGEALFLATGKHELRGGRRPVADRAVSVGFRTALPVDATRTRALDGVVELHLFEGGYCGLLLQEDGRANCSASIETERLEALGGIAGLAAQSPLLGERLDGHAPDWEAIAGVPYGWRATQGVPGCWRIGDQAAVIASLAGDGVAIALASGQGAASAYLAGTTAERWQRQFARRAARPLWVAEQMRHAAQDPRAATAMLMLAAAAPGLARMAARLTRIA